MNTISISKSKSITHHKREHSDPFNYSKALNEIDQFIALINKTSMIDVMMHFTRKVDYLDNSKIASQVGNEKRMKTRKLQKSELLSYILLFGKTLDLLINCALSVRMVFRNRQDGYENRYKYYSTVPRAESHTMQSDIRLTVETLDPYIFDSETLAETFFPAIKYIFFYFKERRIDSKIDYSDTQIVSDLHSELEKDYREISNYLNSTISKMA